MLFAIALLAAAPQQPAAQPEPKNDPVVCHRPEAEVGTHMRPKPVCMKKSDWELVEKNTQNQLNKLQDRSSFDPGRAEGARH